MATSSSSSSSPSKPKQPSTTSVSPQMILSDARSQSLNRSRRQSISSESSDSSRTTTTLTKSPPLLPKRPLYAQANVSSTSIHSFSRQLLLPLSMSPASRPRAQNNINNDPQTITRRAESPARDHSYQHPHPPAASVAASASASASGWVKGHRPRQHSQGFFDPTLSSTNITTINPIGATPHDLSMNGLTTSQAAAQAAMSHPISHTRRRSQTLPDPAATIPQTSRRPPPQPTGTHVLSNPNIRNHDGFIGGHSLAAATTAASAVYPRSPQYSPKLPPERAPPPVPEKDIKPGKEKSKIKLFSKPKNIGIHKDEKKQPPLPSPNKMANYNNSTLSRLTNTSTTSLVDPTTSSASSFYSSANASTSTLVPADREREKEKHKHHFLSRQKRKDKDEFHLPLSSASSTSRPTDPNAPQPLYSFAAPSSPSHSSTFAKTVSGFDLRHGGRALREKKKDEKASSLAPTLSSVNLLDAPFRVREQSFGQGADWPGSSSYTGTTPFGPPSSMTNAPHTSDFSISQPGVATLGAAFGVPGITPDDAWPLLKARLLHIFEGEDPRPPIEDFNALVSVHLKRCIQRRAPTVVIEDLNELLQTGFLSLEQTLRHVPDERLVPHLVAMWMLVFSTILPFMQAVFSPLDLEFKGRGTIMTAREAADFWGAALPSNIDISELGANKNILTLGEELDVRRITLLKFRDSVILPRNEALMAIFSRLSLDSISGGFLPDLEPPPPIVSGPRPGTASSTDAALSAFNTINSFTSQASSHLDSASPFSAAARSRATSNTSAGSFHSSIGHQSPAGNYTVPPAMDSAQVTEMVGRMLQCVSVLASVQSGDEAQGKMERLTKELKLNWLGRGRTGRQRRGFVGTRAPRTATVVGAMA